MEIDRGQLKVDLMNYEKFMEDEKIKLLNPSHQEREFLKFFI